MCIPTTDCVYFLIISQGQRRICSMMRPALPSGRNHFFQTIPCRCAMSMQAKEKVSSRKTHKRTWLTSLWHLRSVRYKNIFSLSAQLNIVIKFCKNYFYLTLLSVILVISVWDKKKIQTLPFLFSIPQLNFSTSFYFCDHLYHHLSHFSIVSLSSLSSFLFSSVVCLEVWRLRCST